MAPPHHNNPVDAAYNEVKQLLPMHEPSMIISVGTGMNEDRVRSPHDPDREPSNLERGAEKARQWKKSLLDSNEAHERFETRLNKLPGIAQEAKPVYFRFDVPPDKTLKSVRLGDWKGTDGLETKNDISRPTQKYLEDVREKIKRCAEQLVNIRRARAATVRWETFALDTRSLFYRCPLKAKDQTCEHLRFDSRLHLRQHAIEDHGFVWRIGCLHRPQAGAPDETPDDRAQLNVQSSARDNTNVPIEHGATSTSEDGADDALSEQQGRARNDSRSLTHQHPIGSHKNDAFSSKDAHDQEPRYINWVCFWDHCEGEASGFDTWEDFERHLQLEHRIPKPLKQNVKTFEEWLDSGRGYLDASVIENLSRQGTANSHTW